MEYISSEIKDCCNNCGNFPRACTNCEFQAICNIIAGKEVTSSLNENCRTKISNNIDKFKFYKEDLETSGTKCCINNRLQVWEDCSRAKCDFSKLIYMNQTKGFVGGGDNKECLLQNFVGSLSGIGEIIIQDRGVQFCKNPASSIKSLCCDKFKNCEQCALKDIIAEFCSIKASDPSKVRNAFKKQIQEKSGKEFLEYLDKKANEFTTKGFLFPVESEKYCEIVR